MRCLFRVWSKVETSAQSRQSGYAVHPARAASWTSRGRFQDAVKMPADTLCLVLTRGRPSFGLHRSQGHQWLHLQNSKLQITPLLFHWPIQKHKQTSKKLSRSTTCLFSSSTNPPCQLTPAAHRSCGHGSLAHLWCCERQSDQSQLFSQAPHMDCGMIATPLSVTPW